MKACFVGSGSIGKRHIENLRKLLGGRGESLVLHLLRGTNRKLEGFSVDKEIYDIADLDENYDIIFITNPTSMHLETLKSLINHADCFFVEKPVFDNVDVDLSFIPENKKIYVACPLRHMFVMSRMNELLENEKVIHVRSICSSYLPDWRPGTDYRQCYSAHRDMGGGVRIDLIHEWDYLTFMFDFPEEVRDFSATNSSLEIDSDDIAVYIAKYKDKIIELHLDYFGRTPKRESEFYTDDNVYVMNLLDGSISKNGELIYSSGEEVNDKYMNEMLYFLDFCQGKIENINSIQNAVRVMRLAGSK